MLSRRTNLYATLFKSAQTALLPNNKSEQSAGGRIQRFRGPSKVWISSALVIPADLQVLGQRQEEIRKGKSLLRNTTLSRILAKAIYPNWLPGMLGRMAIDLATY